MVDQDIQLTLHQFAETSNKMFGSYSHTAGFFEAVLGMVLSGTMSHKAALAHIAKWTEKNQ